MTSAGHRVPRTAPGRTHLSCTRSCLPAVLLPNSCAKGVYLKKTGLQIKEWLQFHKMVTFTTSGVTFLSHLAPRESKDGQHRRNILAGRVTREQTLLSRVAHIGASEGKAVLCGLEVLCTERRCGRLASNLALLQKLLESLCVEGFLSHPLSFCTYLLGVVVHVVARNLLPKLVQVEDVWGRTLNVLHGDSLELRCNVGDEVSYLCVLLWFLSHSSSANSVTYPGQVVQPAPPARLDARTYNSVAPCILLNVVPLRSLVASIPSSEDGPPTCLPHIHTEYEENCPHCVAPSCVCGV